MKQLDSTYYSFKCPICEKQIEVCNEAYICDTGAEVIPVCEPCARGLRSLLKSCSDEQKLKLVASSLLNTNVAKNISIDCYHSAHTKLNSKLEKTREVYSLLCDCCGKPIINREAQYLNSSNPELVNRALNLYKKRKIIKKIFKAVKIKSEICICDLCLPTIDLLAVKAKTPEQFVWYIDKTFKYSPFKQN